MDVTLQENMLKPAISLSGGELADIIIAKLQGLEPAETIDYTKAEDKWLKGIPAMAQALGFSPRYFADLKAKGVFKKVIHQEGRTITAKESDLRMAWECYSKRK